jgi:LasA protease
MDVRLPRQITITKRRSKPHSSQLVWFSFLMLLLLPALACNLPSRQSAGLVFPTNQPDTSSENLLLTTLETSPGDGLPATPTSSELTLAPTQPLTSFTGLQTATPGAGQPAIWTTPEPGTILPPFTYWTQSGDTLAALAARFAVSPDQISPSQPVSGLLTAGQQLMIPDLLGDTPYPDALLPDSAVVLSPDVAGFPIADYIYKMGGYLSTYTDQVDDERLSGAEIIRRIAFENSLNPQLLLAILEYRSGWVLGQPRDPSQVEYPIGYYVPDYHGLYLELSLVAKELNIGYYGWRQGGLTDLSFPSGDHVRISPALNPGTVALQNLFSKFYLHQQDWLSALYGQHSLLEIYTSMFGDPWSAAATVGPLFPPGLAQPTLQLPFVRGEAWALTSGPHIAWKTGTPRAALDFAPITGEPPCAVSSAWVTAPASGVVARSERGELALDLDGDGLEQTGWVLVFMHVAEQDRLPVGSRVDTDTPLGHPSCEGGQATGTHVHMARKFNGEWISADGPLPMVLSGWVAHAGKLSYEGSLEKDGRVVSAHPDGSSGSTIIR